MDYRNDGYPHYQIPYSYEGYPYQPPTYTSPMPITPYQYYQKPVIPNQYDGFDPQAVSTVNKQHPSFLQYFQDKNGEMDLDKVFHTVNQLANTYQQVSPLVKNVGSILKSFQR
ncbi:YppG family protein [Gracilibacillus sp. S3-1-1]|uniref:YppG family protein n=1 Tax=Gracilibacillus pellucidus TaxID=3095368 RepID=A0ACC6M5U4_9BACI|nr:YppG family protein [Gracilibacillus sp. S3-1-1]MDX8046319.1 YppG family protein [Gracilibacillus sp. S3-1-1]